MKSVPCGVALTLLLATLGCSQKGPASPAANASKPPAPAPVVAVAPPNASAGKQLDRGSRFARAFHHDVTTFVVVHDLERLFERALSWPVAAELLAALEPGQSRQQSVDGLRKRLSEARDQLPLELAFGVREAGMRQFGRWIRVYLTVGLLYGASGAGDRDAAAALQRDLVAALDEIELPPVVFYSRLRTAEQASAAATAVNLVASRLAASAGVSGRNEADDTTVFEASLSDFVDREALRQALTASFPELMVGSQADNQRVADAVAQLRLRLEVATAGTELTVKLGPSRPPNAKPFRDWALAALPASEALPALHVGYDMRPLQAEARVWSREWQRWRDTPVGAATREVDTTDLLGNLDQVTALLDRGSSRGALRVGLGTEPTLWLHGWEATRPRAANLAASELRTRVPWAPQRAIVLSTTSPVGTGLLNVRDQIEERVARLWLQGLGDGDTDKQDLADRIEDVYYREMAPLRTLLAALPDQFASENALLVEPVARFKSLRVLDKAGKGAGAPQFELNDVPAFHIMLVGRPKKPGTGTALHVDVLRELVAGMGRIAGRQVEQPVTARQDLGLGVPTTVLRGGWMSELLGSVELDMDFDGVPHMFDKDGWWVFSTSVDWSKEFLAGGRPAAPSLPAGVIVDYVDMGPAFFAGLAAAARRFLQMAADAGGDSRELDQARRLVRLLGDRMSVRYWAEQREDERISTGWWSLATPPPQP